MTDRRHAGLAWALLFARLVLGLIFFMAGLWKVFDLGALQHAERMFVEPYAGTFLPTWALWATGTAIPFVELSAGALVIAGLFTRPALVGLGAVLVVVTFGHLVAEPLYQFHTHVVPRLGLLLFILAFPPEHDRWGLDAWRARRAQPSD
jgi:putative oxidoreductase